MRLKIFGLVCVTKRRECLRRKQCGGQGHIAMCSGAVRVCLREGHSTVPYIKLSAPRLSRRSKWSLMAWGRVLSPNSESKSCECPRPEVTDSANHPNFFFYKCMCLCPFCVFPLCLVLIVCNHLLISSPFCGEHNEKPVSQPCSGFKASTQANAHLQSITIHSGSFLTCLRD